MKIRFITKYLLAATLFTGVVACQNPLKDFDLQLSTEVIKHTAVLRIVNVDGNPISDAEIKLVSGDIQDIYNMEGTKDFTVNSGMVIFGLDPNVPVDDNTMIRFRVEITSPGLITKTVPLTIANTSSGITEVTMVPTGNLSADWGYKEEANDITLSQNGSIAQAVEIEVPPFNGGGQPLSLNIPSGTQFKDASGNVITGGAVTVNVGSFDPENDKIDALLPSGSFAVDAVDIGGGNEVAGAFSPAGLTRITMVVNGVAVKEFSQPIEVSIPLPSNYVSPKTNLPIAAGQSFDIFSNSAPDNKWKFERTVTISGDATTGYFANFTISHLSYYMTGEFQEACSNGVRVNFSGSWMTNSSAYPLSILIEMNGRRIYSKTHSISLRASSIVIPSIPSNGAVLTVKNALTGQSIYTSAIASCGQATNVVLPDPSPANATTATLQLYVRCPNRTNVISLLPTFELFYRESGQGQKFTYLGTVVNGLLRTKALKTDGTKYDFQAFYNNRVKEVYNKTIAEDNTATVGTQPGDILGGNAATNLAMLTEECNKL